jgi:hypothetical protein
MRIDSSGNVGIGTNAPSQRLSIQGADFVSSSFNGAGFGDATERLRIGYKDGVPDTGIVSAQILAQAAALHVAARSDTNSFIMFHTTGSERARIDASGNLLVGTTTNTFGEKLAVVASGVTSNTAYFLFNSSDDRDNVVLRHQRASGGTGATQISFKNSGGTTVGTIQTNGTVTVYNTSSDYRLKHDIQPMTGALAKVAQLKPVTYKWKVDDRESQGFIAHELQEVVPECVSGEKDAVNKDGSIKPQGIDTSFLVATLTAAMQEQQAIIEALEARITALEA